MNIVGSALAGFAAAFLVCGLRRPSPVARRLALLRPATAIFAGLRPLGLVDDLALEQSGLGWSHERLAATKVAAGLMAGLAAALVALFAPIGALLVLGAAYVGFVAPSVVVERRSAARRADAERATVVLVEWACTLVAAGRPVESALAALARRGIGSPLADDVLARAERLYTLGASLYVSLAREARSAALPMVVRLAERLERARELGHGSLSVLEDIRDELRASERARAVDAASRVEGNLTLVLTLCYLPALALLVIIPLFLTLLAGLAG